jgi:hypothetical protein
VHSGRRADVVFPEQSEAIQGLLSVDWVFTPANHIALRQVHHSYHRFFDAFSGGEGPPCQVGPLLATIEQWESLLKERVYVLIVGELLKACAEAPTSPPEYDGSSFRSPGEPCRLLDRAH